MTGEIAALPKADPSPHELCAGFCRDHSIPVVAEIPYDDSVTQAMIRGQAVTEMGNGAVAHQVGRIWEKIRERLTEGR